MKGNELFKVAVRSMADISAEMLEKAGYTVDDIDLVIPHQANQRITDAVASRLGVPEEKVYSNIAEHGILRPRRFRSRSTNASSPAKLKKAALCC